MMDQDANMTLQSNSPPPLDDDDDEKCGDFVSSSSLSHHSSGRTIVTTASAATVLNTHNHHSSSAAAAAAGDHHHVATRNEQAILFSIISSFLKKLNSSSSISACSHLKQMDDAHDNPNDKNVGNKDHDNIVVSKKQNENSNAGTVVIVGEEEYQDHDDSYRPCHYFTGLVNIIAVLLTNLQSPSLTLILLEKLARHHFHNALLVGSSSSSSQLPLSLSSSSDEDMTTTTTTSPSQQYEMTQAGLLVSLLEWADVELLQHLMFYDVIRVRRQYHDKNEHDKKAAAAAAAETDDDSMVVVQIPPFIHGWISGWFAGDAAPLLGVASRLVDAFIASHFLLPLYTAVALLHHYRHDLLQITSPQLEYEKARRNLRSIQETKKTRNLTSSTSNNEDNDEKTKKKQDISDKLVGMLQGLPLRMALESMNAANDKSNDNTNSPATATLAAGSLSSPSAVVHQVLQQAVQLMQNVDHCLPPRLLVFQASIDNTKCCHPQQSLTNHPVAFLNEQSPLPSWMVQDHAPTDCVILQTMQKHRQEAAAAVTTAARGEGHHYNTTPSLSIMSRLCASANDETNHDVSSPTKRSVENKNSIHPVIPPSSSSSPPPPLQRVRSWTIAHNKNGDYSSSNTKKRQVVMCWSLWLVLPWIVIMMMSCSTICVGLLAFSQSTTTRDYDKPGVVVIVMKGMLNSNSTAASTLLPDDGSSNSSSTTTRSSGNCSSCAMMRIRPSIFGMMDSKQEQTRQKKKHHQQQDPKNTLQRVEEEALLLSSRLDAMHNQTKDRDDLLVEATTGTSTAYDEKKDETVDDKEVEAAAAEAVSNHEHYRGRQRQDAFLLTRRALSRAGKTIGNVLEGASISGLLRTR
jgi:hypothetical protein